jgi:hypothetical protein
VSRIHIQISFLLSENFVAPLSVALLTMEGETDTILDLRNLNANSDYSVFGCVQDDGYTVVGVTDTSGDGLLGDGFLTLTYRSEVLYDDWDLGFGFDMKLGNGCT